MYNEFGLWSTPPATREFIDWWKQTNSDYEIPRLLSRSEPDKAIKDLARRAYAAGRRHGRKFDATTHPKLSYGLRKFLRFIVFNPGLQASEITKQLRAITDFSDDMWQSNSCVSWRLEALQLVGLIEMRREGKPKGHRFHATQRGTYYGCDDMKGWPVSRKTGRNRNMFTAYLYGTSLSSLAKQYGISITQANHCVRNYGQKLRIHLGTETSFFGPDLSEIRKEAAIYIPLLNDRKKLWELRLL